jgi:multidrug transporter EmrE-like cation transporter
VFVFYLGNSVALTLFALTVIYSIWSAAGFVNLFFTEIFFYFLAR